MKILLCVFGLMVLVAPITFAHAAEGAAMLSLGLGKIFTFFFLTLGPASVIAPFARGTAGLDDKSRRRVAFAVTGISLTSVVVAATIGVWVLINWGISTAALLITAGIILFLVALQSIRSQYSPTDDAPGPGSVQTSLGRLAFQMAFPYIVSPYGIAIVILVLTTRPDSVPLGPIVGMLGGIMSLNALAMLVSHRIVRSIYLVPVLTIVASVLAVLQAALGVHAVLTGLKLAGVT